MSRWDNLEIRIYGWLKHNLWRFVATVFLDFTFASWFISDIDGLSAQTRPALFLFAFLFAWVFISKVVEKVADRIENFLT